MPNKLRKHEQILHNPTILIILLDKRIVTILILKADIHKRLILQRKKLLLPLFNIVGETFPLIPTNENLLVEIF